LRILEKLYSHNYYYECDHTPVYNWLRLNESGEIKYLIRRKPVLFLFKKSILNTAYRKLFDDYIRLFGFGDNAFDVIRLKKRIAAMQVKMITTGDESIETFIDLAHIDLLALQKRVEDNINSFEFTVFLEKQVGYSIDLMTTTVTKYYSIINALQKMKQNG